MKVLYISDLDGTLLNENAELSSDTAERLNKLIDNGLNFTVATARTSATVVKMLCNLNVNFPAVLMNGAVIYDIKKDRCIEASFIEKNAAEKLAEISEKNELSGFLYCIENGKLETFYSTANTKHSIDFMNERKEKYSKVFTKVDSLKECTNKSTVYYSVADKKEKLFDVYEEMKNCDGIHVEFYRDIYLTDYWYLEACSENVSKHNAVKRLKELGNFEKLVCFGDNLNDLPMFTACDEAYAVSNAKEEVKNAASGIISSNTENGVAEFLENRLLHNKS